MSNLGGYEELTKVAKRLGGPQVILDAINSDSLVGISYPKKIIYASSYFASGIAFSAILGGLAYIKKSKGKSTTREENKL